MNQVVSGKGTLMGKIAHFQNSVKNSPANFSKYKLHTNKIVLRQESIGFYAVTQLE